MKKIYTLLLLAVIALGANAKLVDLGELQLDTDYQIAGDYNDYIGSFVAPTSGTLIVTGTNSTILEPYHAKLSNMESEGNKIEVTYDNFYGNKQYHFDITEGTTYYFYLNFCMNKTVLRLTMDNKAGIEISQCIPAIGSVFSASGGGLAK